MSSGLSKKRQSSTGKVPHEKQSREITRAFPVFTNSFCVPGFILQLQFSASLDFFIRLFFPCQSFCLLNQCGKLIESLKNVQLHVTFFLYSSSPMHMHVGVLQFISPVHTFFLKFKYQFSQEIFSWIS